FLLFFFIGFVVAAQIGGRVLDKRGAKLAVGVGCGLGAVGYYLWAGHVTTLSFSDQQWYIILSGAGLGFMLGPSSTDAVNRASRLSYGEATGVNPTVRNYFAGLGLAVLGTILVTELRSRITGSLVAQGLSKPKAQVLAAQLSQSASGSGSGSSSGSGSGSTSSIPHFYRLDFAYATREVLYVMAGVMAVAAVVAIVGLRRGVQEDQPGAAGAAADQPVSAVDETGAGAC